MWKIYQHELPERVVLVNTEGNEVQLSTDRCRFGVYYFTVEDRDGENLKIVTETGSPGFKPHQFFSLTEAVEKCALLNT